VQIELLSIFSMTTSSQRVFLSITKTSSFLTMKIVLQHIITLEFVIEPFSSMIKLLAAWRQLWSGQGREVKLRVNASL